jgi:hypothetical protein
MLSVSHYRPLAFLLVILFFNLRTLETNRVEKKAGAAIASDRSVQGIATGIIQVAGVAVSGLVGCTTGALPVP